MAGGLILSEDGRAWLLWDGECRFCARAVAWVERKDAGRRFRPLPYQQAPSPPMTPALFQACACAVHVVKPDGSILAAGRATLYVLERTGWGGFARLLALPPFVWLVEAVYRVVADHRFFVSRFLFTRE